MVRVIPAFLALIWMGASAGYAQSFDELEQSNYNRASVYSYAEPGDVTIQVNVWGAVSNPGRYIIPRGTEVGDLFTYAGGPSTGQQNWQQEQILTIRLSREKNDEHVVIFEARMEDEVFAFEENPVLQEGDVLMVERYVREKFTWRDAFTIASGLSTTILLVERFISLALSG